MCMTNKPSSVKCDWSRLKVTCWSGKKLFLALLLHAVAEGSNMYTCIAD